MMDPTNLLSLLVDPDPRVREVLVVLPGLRAYRQDLGLTLAQVAEASGVGESTLSRIETHKLPATLHRVEQLLQGFQQLSGASRAEIVSRLLRWSSNPPPPLAA